MSEKIINCPQCGSPLLLAFRYTKLTTCEHCSSTIFLEDEGAKLAGKQSVMPESLSLLQLKTPFQYAKQNYLPVGFIRYRYEQGFWDEWWVLDGKGEGTWVSVDEGDYAFEKRLENPPLRPAFADLHINQNLINWVVTEIGQATCEAVKGELPESIELGETFFYAHLSGNLNELITLEYLAEGTLNAYQGYWIDPFEVRLT